ncbi:MAG TPA: hypothetical protein VH475_18870 [Tepidisphaeraceae bacterium]
MKRQEIPAVRILPMSDRIPGFRNRSIEDIQQRLFLRDLPACAGRFRYRATGLNTPPGTLVLFQFRARVIATAVFVRDERFNHPAKRFNGVLHFEPASIRTFDPVDAPAMQRAWPAFRNFGHVKQRLNPGRYPAFKRRLKNVRSPGA